MKKGKKQIKTRDQQALVLQKNLKTTSRNIDKLPLDSTQKTKMKSILVFK